MCCDRVLDAIAKLAVFALASGPHLDRLPFSSQSIDLTALNNVAERFERSGEDDGGVRASCSRRVVGL